MTDWNCLKMFWVLKAPYWTRYCCTPSVRTWEGSMYMLGRIKLLSWYRVWFEPMTTCPGQMHIFFQALLLVPVLATGFMQSWKTWKRYEIQMTDFQDSWRSHGTLRTCQKSWKMEIYHKNRPFGPSYIVIFIFWCMRNRSCVCVGGGVCVCVCVRKVGY